MHCRIIPCHVNLSYIIPCHTINLLSCQPLLHHAFLHHRFNVKLCFIRPCHTMNLYYIIPCHIMSSHVNLCYILPCHIISCHVNLCYIMPCHIISSHVNHSHILHCVIILLKSRFRASSHVASFTACSPTSFPGPSLSQEKPGNEVAGSILNNCKLQTISRMLS